MKTPDRRRNLLLSLIGIAILVLTFWSPLLLGSLTTLKADWPALGNIGQAYGFASAALSGLALIAVSYSILVQQKDARTNRVETLRSVHTELLRMAIDDPSLVDVIMNDLREPLETRRKYLYANLLVQFWRMNFVYGGTTKKTYVRTAAMSLFRGEAGLDYWRMAKKLWIPDGAWNQKDQEFLDIMEAAYQESIRVSEIKKTAVARSRSAASRLTAATPLLSGVALGFAFAALDHYLRRGVSQERCNWPNG